LKAWADEGKLIGKGSRQGKTLLGTTKEKEESKTCKSVA